MPVIKRVIVCAAGLMLTLSVASTLYAQSEIYSLPSATVTDKGSLYCETDANLATTPVGATTFMQRCMGGVAKGLEVGVNGLGVLSNPPAAAEIQPNLKYQWLSRGQWQVASGVTAFLPVSHTGQQPAFAMLYTVGRYQTKVNGLAGYAPAFSAGAWSLVGAQRDSGSRSGVILAVEQPVVLDRGGAPRASFVMDFESGNQTHAGFSSLTPGVVLNLPRHFVLAAGYSISNISSKYNTPALWLGYTFKL